MKKGIVVLISFICLVFIVIELISCQVIIFNRNGFNNKDEIIQCVKSNIEDLNLIVDNLYTKYEYVKTPITIERKNNAIWNNSIEAIGFYGKILDKNSLRYIEFDPIYSRITFCTYTNYQSTYCGFYYSRDNNKCLRETTNYISNSNWTVHFFQEKSGWYTEKICDNWYYYEEDWDQFNFLNYIKDDLKQMKEHKEIYDRYSKYFDE